MGSSSFGSKVTSSTRRHSFSKMTLWCFGAAATASDAGSQVDGSKSARLSAMLPSPVQFNGLNSIAQLDLSDVRFTPKSGHRLSASRCRLCANSGHPALLFDHLVGTRKERWRYGETKRFGGFQVNHQFELGRRLHREVSGLLTFKNAIDVTGRLP